MQAAMKSHPKSHKCNSSQHMDVVKPSTESITDLN